VLAVIRGIGCRSDMDHEGVDFGDLFSYGYEMIPIWPRRINVCK
jgi:hypothetical protein